MPRKAVPKEPEAAEIMPDNREIPDTQALVPLGPPAKEVSLVNEDLVQKAVHFINEKANETLYKGSEEIGAYLLTTFFDNDIEFASSRNPYKSASYTALCQRQDLLVRAGTLSVAVRVAAQEQFFREKGFDSQGLSYTHKAELVKLPNTEAKLSLAEETLESAYTTRALAEQVKKIREEIGGTERQSPIQIDKYLDDPARLFENERRNEFLTNPDNLKKMKVHTRQRLLEKSLAMVDKTWEWTKRYQALVKQLEKIG